MILILQTIPILFHRFQWRIVERLISSGRPDLSRSVSSFLADCAVPSRRISSWPGRTFRTILQEVFFRSPRSVVRLDFSFPLLRRPSTVVIQFWKLAEEKLSMNCSWYWWSEASNKAVPLSGRPDLSSLAIELHGSWLPWLLFPGHTEVEDGTCDGVLAIRFIIGLDFAVTRSPPESCWDRFAIVSEHTVELKWLILNKHNKWFHSSRVKFPLVKMWASWFLE